jgi:hypothetical protein
MMNQSKTPFEAEIDLAELVDFWRLNAYYLEWLYTQQPDQAPGELNRFDWRPLEGFVLAISPFNFYSIGGNLATAPALVGNVVLWKPARSVLLANYRIMQLLLEAGLPAGVINFVPFASRYTDAVLGHPALAGLHFTGSYETQVQLWQRIGERLPVYRNFPRIVGETGGKDFIVVHPSADLEMVAAIKETLARPVTGAALTWRSLSEGRQASPMGPAQWYAWNNGLSQPGLDSMSPRSDEHVRLCHRVEPGCAVHECPCFRPGAQRADRSGEGAFCRAGLLRLPHHGEDGDAHRPRPLRYRLQAPSGVSGAMGARSFVAEAHRPYAQARFDRGRGAGPGGIPGVPSMIGTRPGQSWL